MRPLAAAYTQQKLCLDFAHLKHACPKGIYVAPVPDVALLWTGVCFVRKGPYANAVLRFQIDFPEDYPERPPIVTFLSDVFHPLVTPLTTYTYSTRDTGGDTVSAADEDRLPPGGLSLRHGFPEWFHLPRGGESGNKDGNTARPGHLEHTVGSEANTQDTAATAPLTVEVLQYLRVMFDTGAVLDSVPLEEAANIGAWHAWRSYRSKILGRSVSPSTGASSSNTGDTPSERSTSPRQQPGGARRPGEWNWQGVWEDRVKKSVEASASEHMLYASYSASNVICFDKMDTAAVDLLQSTGGVST